MVKVLTMGTNLHYNGQNDFARDKVLKQATVYLHVKLQLMDNQIGQHKAAAFCTHPDNQITNDRRIHPIMFLL